MDAFDSRPVQSEENKENTTIPRLRKKRDKPKAIQEALSILLDARVSPTEMFNTILDESQDIFTTYRNAFYADSNMKRFQALLDLLWNSRDIMTEWLRPHAEALICKIVYDEMESAKPALFMRTENVTPEFIANWDINTIMETVGRDMTPTWTKILAAATETKESSEKDKGSKSRNHSTVSNIFLPTL